MKIAVRNRTTQRAGDRILIEQSSGQKQTGSVEEVCGIGNAIWVRHSALNVRKLIHATEVTAIKRHSEKVSPARLAAVQQPILSRTSFVRANHLLPD